MITRLLLIISLQLLVTTSFAHDFHAGKKPKQYDFSKNSSIKKYIYTIPDKYHSSYHDGDSSFTFFLNFPNNDFHLTKVGPTPSGSLRIRVIHEKHRAEYTAKNILRDGELIRKDGVFNVYKEYIGKNGRTEVTSYLTELHGNQITIQKAGDLNLRVYRNAGADRELDYVYSKELSIQKWLELDSYIMKILASFSTNLPNKSIQPTANASAD